MGSHTGRLDDSFLKARLALRTIQNESETLPYEVKNRTGMFEKVLGYVDAVEDAENRESAYKQLFSEVFGNVDYKKCCNELLEIADNTRIPSLREYVLSRQIRYGITDSEDALKKLATLSVDDPHYHDLLVDVASNEIKHRKLNSAFTKLRRLKNMNERASALLRIISPRFLSESNQMQLTTIAAEMHYILLVLFRDGNSVEKVVQKLIGELIRCYIHMGLLETAIEMLDDHRFEIHYSHLIELLFEKMLNVRGKEKTHAVFQGRCDIVRKAPLSYDNFGDWIHCSYIADAIEMPDLSQSLVEAVCKFAMDKSSDNLSAEQRCEVLQNLGRHFDMPSGWYQGHKGNRSRALNMLNQAWAAAEMVSDSNARQNCLLGVALTLAEHDFFEESLAMYRKFCMDHNFAVRFYDEIMFEIIEFYRDLSDEDNMEWGLAQRESWLKINLFHLRQPDDDAEKRISRLILFCYDLNELNEELRMANGVFKRVRIPAAT